MSPPSGTRPSSASESGRVESRSGAGILSFRGVPVGSVQGGCLCFEGTRIPVVTILTMLAGEHPVPDEDVLYSYPSLTQLDLDAARWFDAKWQIRRRRVQP